MKKKLHEVTLAIVAVTLPFYIIQMQTMADEVMPLSTIAAAVINGADEPGSRYTLQVDSVETLTGLTIGGSLAKTGAGSLILQNNGFPEGCVEVLAGMVTLAAGTTAVTNELPVYLRNNLALWLDANRNVIMNPTNSTVDEWRDVRDDVTIDATSCVYRRAVRYMSDNTPMPTAPLTTLNGLQALDFGEYGSGCWLDWVGTNSVSSRMWGIRTIFLVLAPPAGGMGFVMGDWTHSSGTGGYKDFHKGSPAGSAGGTILSGTEIPMAIGWAARYVGNRINVAQTNYAPSYQLLEVVTTNSLTLSNFCNDRNFRTNVGGYTGISRQGGALIGEVLIFTRELPETERRAVAAYLNAKWFSKNTAGKLVLAADTTATAEVTEAHTPLILNAIAGQGTFAKTGAGTLSLGWASDLFMGQTVLHAGTLDSNGFVSRVTPLTLVQGGLLANVAGHAVTMSPQIGDAARFSKSGDGVLCVASVTNSIRRLTVAEGTLRLQPGAFAANAAVGLASVPNPSFETNTLGGGNFSVTATASGWVFEAETSVNGGQQKSSLTKGAGSGSPMCGAVMPDGSVGAYIQRAAKITTQVTFSEAGVYKLTFWVVGRPNRPYGDQYVAAYVDGVMGGVVTASATATDAFVKYTCTLPAVTQGTHTLVIRGLRDDQDRTAVVDQISIELVRTGHFAMLPNEGFEFTTSVGGQHPAFPGSTFMYNAVNAGWQFNIVAEPGGGSGITDANGTWTRTILEGNRAAFLQRSGSMSAPVIFPETGRYRLTFLAAARREKTGLDFAVRLDGEELGRFLPLSEIFTPYVVVLPERITGTTNTLEFAGLNNNNEDNVDRGAVIDQVIIERIDNNYDADNGFENGLAVWQFGGMINRSGIVSFGASNDAAAIEGTNAALVQGTSALWRSVTPDVSGVLQLSFAAAGRQAVSKNYQYYAHNFKIWFGGVEVGQVTTEDDAFRRYTFRLPYAEAGQPLELRFVGLNSQGRSESFSLIDDIRIEPLLTHPLSTLIARSTEIEIAEGAMLDLDYGGSVCLETLRYGGRSVTGVISAMTQPLFVTGNGAVYASPKGTLILLK